MAQTCKRQLCPVYSALPKLYIIFKSINLIQIQPPLNIDIDIYLIDNKLKKHGARKLKVGLVRSSGW